MSNGSITINTQPIADAVSRLADHIDHVSSQVEANREQMHNDMRLLQVEVLGAFAATWERLNSIRGEITRGIEAEAQARILEQFSQIAGQMALISASAQRLSQQYGKTIMRMGRISRKFDKLNDEAEQSYHTDIRRLGKYIFEIWETLYQKTVQNRIGKQHTGFLTTVSNSIESIRKMREERLAQLLNAASSKLSVFVQKRENFHNSVAAIKIKVPFTAAGEIALPMILMNVKNSGRTVNFSGYEIAPAGGAIMPYELKETDMLRSWRMRLQNIDYGLKWRVMNSREISVLEHNLRKLSERGYISAEYSNYLIDALKNQPLLVPAANQGAPPPGKESRNTGDTTAAKSRKALPRVNAADPTECGCCGNAEVSLTDKFCRACGTPFA